MLKDAQVAFRAGQFAAVLDLVDQAEIAAPGNRDWDRIRERIRARSTPPVQGSGAASPEPPAAGTASASPVAAGTTTASPAKPPDLPELSGLRSRLRAADVDLAAVQTDVNRLLATMDGLLTDTGRSGELGTGYQRWETGLQALDTVYRAVERDFRRSWDDAVGSKEWQQIARLWQAMKQLWLDVRGPAGPEGSAVIDQWADRLQSLAVRAAEAIAVLAQRLADRLAYRPAAQQDVQVLRRAAEQVAAALRPWSAPSGSSRGSGSGPDLAGAAAEFAGLLAAFDERHTAVDAASGQRYCDLVATTGRPGWCAAAQASAVRPSSVA
jgi:hypothetical protein